MYSGHGNSHFPASRHSLSPRLTQVQPHLLLDSFEKARNRGSAPLAGYANHSEFQRISPEKRQSRKERLSFDDKSPSHSFIRDHQARVAFCHGSPLSGIGSSSAFMIS